MIIALFLIVPFLLMWFTLKDVIKQSFNEYLNGISSKFVLIFLLILGLVLLFIPLIITNFSIIPLTYTNTGEIGDIIGGSTAPFIGFIGIIVTFYAFWVQYQSNINQRNDIRLERFENQYYEMLRLHKENVQEMEIDDKIKGRKCFVRMFEEFKFVYLTSYQLSFFNSQGLGKQYSKENLCDIAYKVFFNGLYSISILELDKLKDKSDIPFLKSLNQQLHKTKELWKTHNLSIGSCSQTVFNEDRSERFLFEILYSPFSGHNLKLGHYYRHLFQTVSFIVNSEIVPNRLDKYKYLKLLRAQMSNHEQALLYYNGLTTFGKAWINEGYFEDYRMIKNIPFDIADFGVKPLDKIKSPNKYNEVVFEWEE